nr:MAG TPA: hypothetical protein [Caudoviricetes sp.]
MANLEELTKKAEEMEKQLTKLKLEIKRAKNDWKLTLIASHKAIYSQLSKKPT